MSNDLKHQSTHLQQLHLQQLMKDYLYQMKNWVYYHITTTTTDYDFWIRILGCSCLETWDCGSPVGDSFRVKRGCRKCYGTGMIPLFDPAILEVADMKAVEALKKVHEALSK